MITIHQRNQNVSNDNDTFSKSAQNSLPWVLPDKYIIDRLTIQLILSFLTLFSLFLPSMNKSLFEKCNVLLSLMTNNSSMNTIPISNSTYVQISSAKYIPLLCRIWSDVLEWYKHVFEIHLNLHIHLMTRSELQFTYISVFTWWQDQSYSSANYKHCSAKLSVNFHNSQFTTVLSLSMSAQRLSFRFFLEGRHLSKFQLGANVTLIEFFTW